MFTLFLLGLAQSLAGAGAPPPPTASAMIVTSASEATAARTAGDALRSPVLSAQVNEIRRSSDGLFYVTARVNGASIRFIVDTGATVVVLTPDDARRAGVAVGQGALKQQAETANGRAPMARVKLDDVVVGSRRLQAIDAAVVGQGLPVSLLGQSWLSRLASVTIVGDRMIID